MKWLAPVPLVLSSILMAAHFLRVGPIALVVLCLAAPLLLLTRRLAAVRILQVLLVVAAAEWIRTGWVLASQRAAYGAPFARMLVILGAVAAFTLASSIPLRRLARTSGTHPYSGT